jgi:hypothetical protein
MLNNFLLFSHWVIVVFPQHISILLLPHIFPLDFLRRLILMAPRSKCSKGSVENWMPTLNHHGTTGVEVYPPSAGTVLVRVCLLLESPPPCKGVRTLLVNCLLNMYKRKMIELINKVRSFIKHIVHFCFNTFLQYDMRLVAALAAE